MHSIDTLFLLSDMILPLCRRRLLLPVLQQGRSNCPRSAERGDGDELGLVYRWVHPHQEKGRLPGRVCVRSSNHHQTSTGNTGKEADNGNHGKVINWFFIVVIFFPVLTFYMTFIVHNNWHNFWGIYFFNIVKSWKKIQIPDTQLYHNQQHIGTGIFHEIVICF